jgi:cell division septation protein DedD
MGCIYFRAVPLAAAGFGLSLGWSTVALADTKAGVDAWSRADYAAAVREWQTPASANDPDALFNLGQAFKLGRGVAQDLNKAEGYYRQAAALGHVQAADNYGLLLFQRGAREQAVPYLQTAAGRGDPRAQYLLGIAYFNGAPVAKDWVRGYALVTLSSQQGLAQAGEALAEMAKNLSPAEREQAAALAKQLDAKAAAQRARQNVPVDPGDSITAGTGKGAGPSANLAKAAPKSTPPAPAKAAATLPSRPAGGGGPWRVQLGAFGQAANADALWAKIKGRSELAGHPRSDVRSGVITRLQASGFATHDDAAAACSRLTAAGFTCIPAQK